MTKQERKMVIIAMEILARNVNSEDVFDYWLSCGIPDGEINYDEAIQCPDIARDKIDDYDLYLTDDNWYIDLCQTFLRLMRAAYNDGGLCTV